MPTTCCTKLILGGFRPAYPDLSPRKTLGKLPAGVRRFQPEKIARYNAKKIARALMNDTWHDAANRARSIITENHGRAGFSKLSWDCERAEDKRIQGYQSVPASTRFGLSSAASSSSAPPSLLRATGMSQRHISSPSAEIAGHQLRSAALKLK